MPNQGDQSETRASYSTEGVTGITNSPHDDYRKMNWVPDLVVSSNWEAIFSILGAIGGLFLGNSISITNGPSQLEVIQILSRECVSSIDKCQHLELANNAPVFNLIVGALLMVIYIGGTVYFKFFRKK